MSATTERAEPRDLGFWAAFKRQVARSGPYSQKVMVVGCGALLALAVLGLVIQLGSGPDWRPMCWLLVNPVALVVVVRSWAFERWGRFVAAYAVAVAASVVPWIVGGEWGELPW